ncbi:hypothetical protein ACVRYP_01265 [Streptococcus rifensis]
MKGLEWLKAEPNRRDYVILGVLVLLMLLVIYDPWYWIYDGLVWLGVDEFARTLVFTLVKFGLGLVLLIVLPKCVGSAEFRLTKISWKVVLVWILLFIAGEYLTHYLYEVMPTQNGQAIEG